MLVLTFLILGLLGSLLHSSLVGKVPYMSLTMMTLIRVRIYLKLTDWTWWYLSFKRAIKILFESPIHFVKFKLDDGLRNLCEIWFYFSSNLFLLFVVYTAVEWTIFGCFWTNGQICSATSRLLVHVSVFHAYNTTNGLSSGMFIFLYLCMGLVIVRNLFRSSIITGLIFYINFPNTNINFVLYTVVVLGIFWN